MTAFADAFHILKNEHLFDVTHDILLRKGKAEEAIELRQMRQFVLDNENSPDPAMRQAAEDMYQKLTQIMSAQSRTPPMQAPKGPVGEGATMGDMSQPAQPPQHPMMKAWDNLRKNVVGFQDGQEYKMPPSVASMAQREQIPETMTQTMQSQAPGMFGRFKQPVRQTAQIPTGQMSLGERPPSRLDSGGQPVYPVQNRLREGAVQGNLPHPMGGSNIGPAPGAQVTRMPRPGPYAEDKAGFEHNILSDRNFGTFSRGGQQPMGSDSHYYQQLREHSRDRKGKYMTDEDYTQQLYGDQFNPNRQF